MQRPIAVQHGSPRGTGEQLSANPLFFVHPVSRRPTDARRDGSNSTIDQAKARCALPQRPA